MTSIDGKKLTGSLIGRLKKDLKKLPQLTIGAVLVGTFGGAKRCRSVPTLSKVERVVPESPKATGIQAARGGIGSENSASISFIEQKAKTAAVLGVNFKVFKFDQSITTEKLRKEILKFNDSKNINGIIVQLPLPKHVNTSAILRTIGRGKDIDALSNKPMVFSPVVEAVKYVFKKFRVNYENKNILIVGRGRLVGQPIYKWLVAQVAQNPYREIMRLGSGRIKRVSDRVRMIDIKEKNQLPRLARKADIIISGVGEAGLVKGKMIKKGAILIDFGFSKSGNKIKGDFDFESCVKKARLITPVPGGMGPIMVAMLFKNLAILAKAK